jgi:hypothetical protein
MHGAVLLVAAMFAGNAAVCAAERTAAQEMACCKAGHRTCGRMTSASDCCKSRQITTPTLAVAKQVDVAVIALPASVPALFAPVTENRICQSVATTSKRPHDPPHLHTYSLLI